MVKIEQTRKGAIKSMTWNHSNTFAMAKTGCVHCNGLGMREVRGEKEVPCNCVLRSVFRACYARFKSCVVSQGHPGRVSLESYGKGRDSHKSYGRKNEEYMADFCIITRRTLNPFDYKVFKFHYLLGEDWKLCCRQVNMDRGNFFHAIYTIEQKLGRVFATLRPYGLYPLGEYFGGTVSTDRTTPSDGPATHLHVLRPPMREVMATAELPLAA
jgi:hypothetical protein